jgi:uncharacterized phage protein gp47/JayE
MALYGIKSKSEILVNILDGLQKNAGITAVYPGSVARAFADAVSSEVSDLYEAFRFSISQSDLATASGRNLDLIGDLYGISRKSVSDEIANERRSFNIEFLIDKVHSSDIVIPANTLVYNDVSNFITKQYSYSLQSAVTIPAGSKKAYGRVEPNFTDNSYIAPKNTLTKHNFISPAAIILFCNNPKEVYSNANSESDENYRRRIIASMKSKTSGTAESIRFAALSVKGVKDVRIREASYGIGSCDIIVVPEVSSSVKNLPGAILSAVNSVKPVGVRFNVSIAEKVATSVNLTITLPSGNSANAVQAIRNQVSLFIKRYLNSFSIGDTLSLTAIEMQAKLASDSITGVTINSMTANGQDLPLRDFTPYGVREYISAGNINVYSVIIGNSAY